MSIASTYLNGRPATAEDLAPLAFAGYAHFTAMQVRGQAVRGLDLHLDRLRHASDDLFGDHLPDELVREYLGSAVETAPPDVSLTCFVTSRPGEFMRSGGKVDLDVLIKVTDPATPPPGPLTLEVVEHQRHLPHVKHVGEVAKTRFLRRANARGFDDAAFVDASGHLSEATIWNLAFWDGRSVIWPRADVLRGVTAQMLSRQLHSRGYPQVTRTIRPSDLTEDVAAVVMNSWSPAIAVARIGDQPLADAHELTSLLHQAYDAERSVRL